LKSKILMQLDEPEAALLILESDTLKNFKNDTIFFLIGNCYMDIASIDYENTAIYNKAISAFKNTLELNPKYYYANKLLADCKHNTLNYIEAISIYEKLFKYYPDSFELILEIGSSKGAYGDLSGAKLDLGNALINLKDSSNLSSAYRFLGLVYSKENKIDSALQCYNIAIEFSKDSRYTYADRGYLLINNDIDKQKGCEDLRMAAKLGDKMVYEDIKLLCK